METLTWIVFGACTVFAIAGLVIIYLQKQGTLSAKALYGYTSTAGGKLALGGIIIGALMLSEYNTLCAIFYALVFLMIYYFVQSK